VLRECFEWLNYRQQCRAAKSAASDESLPRERNRRSAVADAADYVREANGHAPTYRSDHGKIGVAVNLLIVITVVAGLALDQHWARHGQVVVSAITWLVLLALWTRTGARERPSLVACLAFATAGEVFLSLVWGLYDYRLGNIPLFVPPGHVLLFFLGTQLAERIPPRGEWWIAALAAPVVALFAWSGRDTLGPLLYALFLSCLALSPSRRLYATMFVLSLAMELYGTWMGNWVWSREVPWLGLATDNPPLAAGAFYCVLDLLVVSATARFRGREATYPPASPGSNASVASTQAATWSARSSSR